MLTPAVVHKLTPQIFTFDTEVVVWPLLRCPDCFPEPLQSQVGSPGASLVCPGQQLQLQEIKLQGPA